MQLQLQLQLHLKLSLNLNADVAERMNLMEKYDVAAYIWPSYTGDEPRTRIFWEQGIGEWQTVQKAVPRFEGHQWPRKPLWGYVNEADPHVMEMQIDEASSHGVNVFIYDWYWYDGRPFLEQCLDNGFLGAANRSKMKFYLMWANHDAMTLWDKRNADEETVVWQGAVDRRNFETIAHRMIERYFGQPEYYTIDGKPVLMIYDVMNLIKGLGGIDATKDALDWFRGETIKAGFPGLELQMTVWSEGAVDVSGVDSHHTGKSRDVVQMLGFDSITHYQFVHFVPMHGLTDYPQMLVDAEKEWQRIDAEYGVPYYPHVSIGWDNNARHNILYNPIAVNNGPENFEKGLRMAKAYADAHPAQPKLITINSWNEWTEDSYLEPDDLHGYGYLDAVKLVFVDEK